MEHQDWNYITWDKTGKKSSESKKDYVERQVKLGSKNVKSVLSSAAVNKNKNTVSNDRLLNRKIEEESEDFRVKRVSMSIAKNIAKKRVELKMSQKELAQKLCLSESIIRDYEKIDGKATYNPAILNKIEKILGRVRE